MEVTVKRVDKREIRRKEERQSWEALTEIQYRSLAFGDFGDGKQIHRTSTRVGRT